MHVRMSAYSILPYFATYFATYILHTALATHAQKYSMYSAFAFGVDIEYL
jgi:hypothetical protein